LHARHGREADRSTADGLDAGLADDDDQDDDAGVLEPVD
jgi:hypothetical protein